MTNLHPMIVHFPIALLLTGLLFSAIAMFCKKCCKVKTATADCPSSTNAVSCVDKMGFWMLALGTLSAAAGVLSGFLFAPEMNSIIFNTHHTFAIATTAIAVVTTAIYAYWMFKARTNEPVKWIAFLLYVAVAALIAITGHYGGMLR